MRAAIAFIVALSSVVAAAQEEEGPQVREAHQRFVVAEDHFANGRYAQALTEYDASRSLLREVNHPRAYLVTYNIARCYVQLGRSADAAAAYEEFLRDAPADEERRPAAESELAELRARVSLGNDGGGGMSPVGWIVLGGGAAVAIAGGIVGGFALSRDAEAQVGCEDGHCPASLAGTADEAHGLAIAADALLFGGLAIATVGLVLVFVLPGDSGAATAALGCSPHRGCGVALAGRF